LLLFADPSAPTAEDALVLVQQYYLVELLQLHAGWVRDRQALFDAVLVC